MDSSVMLGGLIVVSTSAVCISLSSRPGKSCASARELVGGLCPRLLGWVVDIRYWVSHIMNEIRWCFGYRCRLSFGGVARQWRGSVYVPRWHPVRSVGLDDLLILMIGGEWNVFTDWCDTHFEVLDCVVSAAYSLRGMRVAWDRLSSYEREYLIR